LPGGNTPQDPWKNQWEDVDCGVEKKNEPKKKK
jgi:hypothetical protein